MIEAKAPMDGNQERPPEEVVSVLALKDDERSLGVEELGMCPQEGQLLRATLRRNVCEKDLGRGAGASEELGRQKMSADRPCAWATVGTSFGFDSKVELLEGFQLRSDVFQLIF